MNYAQIITESEAELKELEGQKLVQFQKRIRFLLLLKSGEAKTQETAGVMVGWKKRQSQKIWQLYRSGTIREVLRKPERFSFGKLSTHLTQVIEKGVKFLHGRNSRNLLGLFDRIIWFDNGDRFEQLT